MADTNTIETLKKAVEASKNRNFEESVDIAFNLKDVDLSVPKNRVELAVLLPKGRGKDVKVAVFGSAELALKAKKVADLVIQPEDLEDLADDKKKAKKIANTYDFFVAEAPLMPVIGKRLGIVLAPRGKMPRPIPPGADPGPIISGLRNTVRLRSRDKRTFHASVGMKSMKIEDLAENVDEIVKRVIGTLERGKMNLASVYLKTTMGPGIRLM
ncbi:MAG: 50S ribosomal protein L1 [Methanomassiliicoccales archaeon]|nr:MAG: 50S ribosomal protein L1 [Methanomassiliicoccales archaeon]